MVGLVMVAGCTSDNGDEWSSTQTYSGMGVTFEYPGTWVDQSDDPELAQTLGESGVAFGKDDEIFGFIALDVGVLTAADKEELLATLSQTYENDLGLTNQKEITVDGENAQLLSAPSPSDGIYTNVAFWIKNDQVYISVYTSESSATGTYERILNTFRST